MMACRRSGALVRELAEVCPLMLQRRGIGSMPAFGEGSEQNRRKKLGRLVQHNSADLGVSRSRSGRSLTSAPSLSSSAGMSGLLRGGAGVTSWMDLERTKSSSSKDEVTADMRKDIDRFAAVSPNPCSLAEVVECLEPRQSVKFLQTEYLIRCAERIRMIESVAGWNLVSELVDVRDRHVQGFSRMREVDPQDDDLHTFTKVANTIMNSGKHDVREMTQAAQKLVQERAQSRETVDSFLDDFFLNRIGSNFLLSQFLARVDNSSREFAGVVDLKCNVAKLCQQTSSDIANVCQEFTGRQPVINVKAHSADARDAGGVPSFAFIPTVLKYVIQELLKNSCQATVKAAGSTAEIGRRPINIVVSADERSVVVHLSDQAGGIPTDVMENVWSYQYTTSENKATELAGFGVGLPLSRLYARYLGGSLDLVSLPGYGTHAYLHLPRRMAEMIEVVPSSADRR